MAAPENPFAVSVQNPELTYSRGMYNTPQDYVNKARLASFGATGELSPDLEDLTAESFEYSPEAQAYLNKVDQYISGTQAGPYEISPYGMSVTNRQTGAARPLTNEELMAFAAKPDFENQFAASFANPTGEQAWDIGRFVVRPNQDVRVIDRNTGEVVSSGTGYEGGAMAAQAAAGMFGDEGKKANFIVQGAAPGQDWQTITEHVPEKSGFGTFLDISLPMIAGAVVGPLGLAKALGSSALAAGVAAGGGTALSGALQGRSFEDIAKSAAISGLTAGALDASGVSKFLAPTSGGATSGVTAPVVGNVAPVIPGAGDIVVTGIRNLAAPVVSSALSTIPSIANSAAKYSNRSLINDQAAGIDQLPETVVTAQTTKPPFVPPTTNLFGNIQYSGGENVRETKATEDEKKAADSDEIIVTAQKPQVPVPPFASLDAAIKNYVGDKYPTYEPTEQVTKKNPETGEDEIVVTAPKTPVYLPSVLDLVSLQTKPEFTQDLTQQTPKKDTILDKAADIAKVALPLVGALGSAGGGGGTGAGTGKLQSIFSAKLPKPGEGGGFQVGGLGPRTAGPGGTFAARPTTDWYRYGMGPAMDIPAGTDLSRATSPYAGYGPGTLGEETFRRVTGAYSPLAARPQLLPNMVSSLGRDATSGEIETALAGAKTAEEARRINPGTAYFNIDAGTAQALGDPSLVGTVMSIQDLQRRMAARPMAHGGSMGYARGSSRKSFAVEGPGTGRSDDIPAVLSDGEYVLDAETVALLGDGSSKAGAKKLDEMRVRLRKHKGRNLAKGKFSVNAKRPEKYLSGGRT